MRRRCIALRNAGFLVRAGRWAVAIVMVGAFGVACNEEIPPAQSPAADETVLTESPYPAPRTSDPVVPEDVPPDDEASVAPGPQPNTEPAMDDVSPDVGVVEEENVVVPTVSAPEPTTGSNLGAAGIDQCGMAGNDCTIIDNDNSGGGESATNSPGVLTTPEVGSVEIAPGGDTRDESGGRRTSDADEPTTSSSPTSG